MHFKQVEIAHFRNLVSTSFSPSNRINLISGRNGSGKSSLIEALHYLSLGASFRTHKLKQIIQHEHRCFTLFANLSSGSINHRVGLKRCRNLSHQTRIDGSDIHRRSELVHLLPSQVISPESIDLMLGGSEIRRSFIDWALFHVEHSFQSHSFNYKRALKQRNAQLRDNPSIGDLSMWDSQLAEHGEVISQLRAKYIDSLIPAFDYFISLLLKDMDINVCYKQGWNKELELLTALTSSHQNDIKMHHTTVGPHRADIAVRLSGNRVTDSLSRGQLKLVVIAFKLAQITLINETTGISPVILIDDIAAELDPEHRSILLKTLFQLDTQLFITTPDYSLINYFEDVEMKMFHVEHGHVEEVV